MTRISEWVVGADPIISWLVFSLGIERSKCPPAARSQGFSFGEGRPGAQLVEAHYTCVECFRNCRQFGNTRLYIRSVRANHPSVD